MTEDRKITIRLIVNGITLPVVINHSDEAYYRNAAKAINTTIANYSQLYSGKKEEKEIVMMAMIDIALRNERQKMRNDVTVYDDILSSLTKEIEEEISFFTPK